MDSFKLNSERRKQAKSIRIVKSENLKDGNERSAKGRSFLPQLIACIGGKFSYLEFLFFLVTQIKH